ncbi:MAG TPA: type II CAAX endopeptidase family protein [Candidatus Acidoferrales bacterium]|nr:type II CAAX endopeptidase family protein [Candidatus Acidoferrales bacterium]
MSGNGHPPLPPGEPAPDDSTGAGFIPTPPLAPSVPRDLDTPWDTLDLLVLFAFALGMLYLLSNLMAVIAVADFGVPLNKIDQFSSASAGFVVCRQVVWFGFILLFLHAVIRRRTSQPFWSTIGWRGLQVGTLRPVALVPLLLVAGAALAIGADIASQFYNTEKQLPIQALFTSRHGVAYLAAFGILVAPLAEETVFRGYVYPVLARKFGILAGILFTGILFGLVHVPQLWGGWGQIATLVTVGMVLTAVRAGLRSVFASYLVHLGYNGFLFGGFFLDTNLLQHLQR